VIVDEPDSNAPEDTVRQHIPGLVEKAIEIARTQPDMRVVALVAEADAPEAKSLRVRPADALRADDGSLAVIVTRESAKNLLCKTNPSLLEFLGDEGSGPLRGLPVIHAARRRMRTALIEYIAPE
jgi:hypothetical protein